MPAERRDALILYLHSGLSLPKRGERTIVKERSFPKEPEFIEQLLEQISLKIDDQIADRLTDHIFQWHLKETFSGEPSSRKSQLELIQNIQAIKDEGVTSSKPELVGWKRANRYSELALKILCGILIFIAGVWLMLEGRIEYLFITTIGSILLVLDIMTKWRARSWKFH
jgi:hypothetical protein